MQKAHFKAKKYFGQHFLKDEGVLHKIAESITNDGAQIIEIGSGLGDLTKELLKIDRVVAYEIDADAIEVLHTRFANELASKRLILHEGDVLGHFKHSLYDKKYKIVANLPYNIGTKIIVEALKDKNCTQITAMLQKEVASRFCARSSERDFSSLSVLRNLVGDCELLELVPPACFSPPPKVDSAVIRITKHQDSFDEGLASFVRLCFSAPRKTLRSVLFRHYDRNIIERAFLDLDIDAMTRAHQLDEKIFSLLYKSLT